MRRPDHYWSMGLLVALLGHGATALAGAHRGIDIHIREESAPAHHNRVHLFTRRGLPYPAPVIHLRAFKREAKLELWAGQRRHPLHLIRTYPICASSGNLGPKRRQGDLQVPEGFYRINLLNPRSKFHRSMRVSYPNRSDRLLGRRGYLGGQIMIHGGCATIGCIPIRNKPAEQLFNIVRDSWRRFRRWGTIHIFPARMDDQGMLLLRRLARSRPKLLDFWLQLQAGFLHFEKTRRLPRIHIDSGGRYQLLR